MSRPRARAITVVSACLLLAATLLGRQTIVTDGSLARDSTPVPKGTAVVMGKTIDAASGKPLGDVVVTLSLITPTYTGYPAVVSDDQGRFVVRDLPKGAFRFYAVKPGYIPGAYSKRQPFFSDDTANGQTMDLNDAEHVVDVTITLWKYAAIEGTVTDETGDPIVGTSVRALPRRVIAGRSMFSFETGAIPYGTYSARTDDRGVYRLDSLPPGDYVVAVPVIAWSAPKSRVRRRAPRPRMRPRRLQTD